MRGLLWIPVIVGLAVAAAALDGERGIGTWMRLQGDLAAAEERIEALNREIGAHQKRVDSLTSDSFAIEQAIREELWYAREGETLVRLRRPGLATPRND